jgi:hypothetical protein
MFTGSTSTPNANYKAFWNDLYAAHAALVLNGHRHYYDRFAPQDPNGNADANGVTEIIAGTGGATLGTIKLVTPNMVAWDDTHFGVLFLTLGATSFSWQFIATNGSTLDSGTQACTPRP